MSSVIEGRIEGRIEGVWKLKKYARCFLDTGEVRNDMLPQAYILYTRQFINTLTWERTEAFPVMP